MQAYEDDCCSSCGTPRTYGADPDADRHFHVKTSTCHGCAALAREDVKRGDRPLPPGQREYVVPDDALTHAMTFPFHVPPLHT